MGNNSTAKMAETNSAQIKLFTIGDIEYYPRLRFMGSKYKLLPWIEEVLSQYSFESALDAFSGSSSVGYLLKTMGKQVFSNDHLNFCSIISKAIIENNHDRIDGKTLQYLLKYDPAQKHFIESTFNGIFFTQNDLRFLDRVSWNIRKLENPYHRSLAISALIRSCVKRQPRGVFTVAGDPEKYKDGRRDLQLTIEEHFIEQIGIYNRCVFSNGKNNRSSKGNIFDLKIEDIDLVYLDPPYVPRSDDNCYIKRYHFLEGLSSYWDGVEIDPDSRVKKIPKVFTPFSYRRTAIEAFDSLFNKFSPATIVLSYSSNGFPDLDVIVSLMRKYKKSIKVFQKAHRYHFGTHANATRNNVQEYLIVGSK